MALLLAMVTSASASAALQYSVSSFDGGAGNSGVSAGASGSPAELPGPVRLVVTRAGTTVVDQTGIYNTYESPPGQFTAYSSANSSFNAQPGDTVYIYNPSTAAAPAKAVTINRPTIDSCPVGSASFTGKRAGVAAQDNNSFDYGSAFRPGLVSGDPNRFNQGTVSGTGDDYTTTLQRPLAAGDLVSFGSDRKQDADTYTYREISRTAGTCVPQPQPQPAAPAALPAPFNGIVNPLSKKDVKQSSNPFVILVTIRCSPLSRVPCVGNLLARTTRKFASNSAVNASAAAKKKAKKKVLQLARKSFSVAPGKTTVVKLKLTKQGQRLLKRQRKLAIRVSSVTRDAVTGVPRTSSRAITLKAKKAKKAKKKK
jgi:hypothetical protein